MSQFIKKHDIWLRLLSLVLAFVLWAIVMDEENPNRTVSFSDFPVTVKGESQLLAVHGLSLIEAEADGVFVQVSGPRNQIQNKDDLRRRITAEIDLSGISEPGEYDLAVSVVVSRAGVEVSSISPRSIHVRVDKVTTATVPVRVDAAGTPANGYRIGKPEPVTTDRVTIEGPASELDGVAYAYAVISAEGRQATVTEDCALTLYSDAGQPITNGHVTCKTGKIKVRLPVYPIETIPLTVTLKDGGTVSAAQTKVSIEPGSINVVGDPNVIAGMSVINLGEIDLGSIKIDVPLEIRIPLPDGVRLDEGQPQYAKVTVTVDGVSTRKLQVTSFVPTDTAADTGAYQTAVVTPQVEVELRGSESALAEVDANSFKIGLTFDSSALGAGTHSIKGVVVVSGLPAGVALVEEDVQVMIEITGTGSDTGEDPTGDAGGTPDGGGAEGMMPTDAPDGEGGSAA